jgi:hypothetical protein
MLDGDGRDSLRESASSPAGAGQVSVSLSGCFMFMCLFLESSSVVSDVTSGNICVCGLGDADAGIGGEAQPLEMEFQRKRILTSYLKLDKVRLGGFGKYSSRATHRT